MEHSLEVRNIFLSVGRHDRLEAAQRNRNWDVRIYHSYIIPLRDQLHCRPWRVERDPLAHRVMEIALSVRV